MKKYSVISRLLKEKFLETLKKELKRCGEEYHPDICNIMLESGYCDHYILNHFDPAFPDWDMVWNLYHYYVEDYQSKEFKLNL